MHALDRDEYAEANKREPGWGYWHLWVLGISTAFAIASMLMLYVSQLASVYPSPTPLMLWDDAITYNVYIDRWSFNYLDLAFLVLTYLTYGAAIGAIQSILLQRYLPWIVTLRWLTITIVAWLLAGIGTGFQALLIPETLFVSYFMIVPILTAVLSGGIVGTLQASVLDRYVEQANRWRWTNIAATLAGLFALIVLGYLFPTFSSRWELTEAEQQANWHYELVLGAAIQGAVFAAVTGLVIIDMLRHLRPAEPATP